MLPCNYFRKDTKTLYLRNSTLLPVAWRLNGLENLGDDFSVSQESGIIEPCSEFALHSYFRAMKPVSTNRRAIRLEVSLPTHEGLAIGTDVYHLLLPPGVWCWQHHGSGSSWEYPSACWGLRCCSWYELSKRWASVTLACYTRGLRPTLLTDLTYFIFYPCFYLEVTPLVFQISVSMHFIQGICRRPYLNLVDFHYNSC